MLLAMYVAYMRLSGWWTTDSGRKGRRDESNCLAGIAMRQKEVAYNMENFVNPAHPHRIFLYQLYVKKGGALWYINSPVNRDSQLAQFMFSLYDESPH